MLFGSYINNTSSNGGVSFTKAKTCYDFAMTIRCITFDLDDTLWECWPIIKRAEHALIGWLDQHYPRITQQYSTEDLFAHRMAFTKARPEMHHNLTFVRKEWLKQLANEHNYDESMSEVGFQVFWEERNRVTFLDGILEALERLQEDYMLGVITNGNADVNHIGIGHLFNFSIKAEDAGVAKPHPAIFELATQKSNLPAQHILHVGDDPIGDIKGAQEAGMRTLWVNYNNKNWQDQHVPEATVTSPLKLEQAIRGL